MQIWPWLKEPQSVIAEGPYSKTATSEDKIKEAGRKLSLLHISYINLADRHDEIQSKILIKAE